MFSPLNLYRGISSAFSKTCILQKGHPIRLNNQILAWSVLQNSFGADSINTGHKAVNLICRFTKNNELSINHGIAIVPAHGAVTNSIITQKRHKPFK
jgi:hypothetical protein